MFVGKVDMSDEFLISTPMCVRRFEKSKAWDKEFMRICIGFPRNPTGKLTSSVLVPSEEFPMQRSTRSIFLKRIVLDQYGRTCFCRRCENPGRPHNETCSSRVGKAVIAVGEAIGFGDGKREAHEEPP